MLRYSLPYICTILEISVLWIVSCVSARTHHRHNLPEPLKYSYGIYTPVGWTVALYIWYIVKLGFVLGALLLLLFAKKWNSRSQPITFESGPQLYHHRSFDAPGQDMFVSRNKRDVTLFWRDRIETLAAKLR